MYLAAIDWVWLIIAIIVVIGKLWNRFVTTQAEEEEPPPAPRPPPVRRQARPRPRPAPAPVRQEQEKDRQAPPEDLREFMERLTRPPQPKPVMPPPPITQRVPPPPAPKPAMPAAPPPAPAQTSRRASQWAEALRDRQNLRNIIISAEIIGPPRGV